MNVVYSTRKGFLDIFQLSSTFVLLYNIKVFVTTFSGKRWRIYRFRVELHPYMCITACLIHDCVLILEHLIAITLYSH